MTNGIDSMNALPARAAGNTTRTGSDRSIPAKTIAVWLIRVFVAMVFIAAGVPKVMDPAGFAAIVGRYEVLPNVPGVPGVVPAFAVVLPWVEMVAGLALLGPRRWRLAGGVMLAVLLLIFMGAALSAWWRGLEIACGCFSTTADATPIGWWLFVRDTGLLMLVTLAIAPVHQRALSTPDH